MFRGLKRLFVRFLGITAQKVAMRPFTQYDCRIHLFVVIKLTGVFWLYCYINNRIMSRHWGTLGVLLALW